MKDFSPSLSAPRGLALFVSLAVLATGSLAVSAGQALARQEAAVQATDFLLAISVEGDRARLHCERGCAWITLSFSLPVDGPARFVDFYGTAGAGEQAAAGPNGRFRIGIERAPAGVSLSCVAGCGWSELSFACADGRCARSVDHGGLLAEAGEPRLPLGYVGDAATAWFSEHAHGVTISAPRDPQGPPPLVILDGERVPFERLEELRRDGEIGGLTIYRRDVAVERFGEAAAHGAVVATSAQARRGPPPPPLPGPPAGAQAGGDDPSIFVVIEQMPEPVGGLGAIQARVRYPELARRAGIEGTVYAQFVVNEDGSVSEARCVRDPGAGTCEAAIAAIHQTDFAPGTQRGVPVRVRFSLPVRFVLPEEAGPERSGERMSVRVEVDREHARGMLVVRGDVVDEASGIPLAGASAQLVSGQRIVGAATGPDGRFSIRVDEDVVLREGAPLRVTLAGREAVEVDLRGHARPRADLEADAVEFSVSGVHPQPSGNEVLIMFSLPEDADVRVDVFDMAGRRVMQVPARRISAGASLFVSVDARRLASGTYAYRLVAEMESGTRSASGQLTIVR